MELRDMVEQESLQLQRLADLVTDAIKEEQLLSSRLLEIEHDSELSFGQMLADRVAELDGSWIFTIIFL